MSVVIVSSSQGHCTNRLTVRIVQHVMSEAKNATALENMISVCLLRGQK